MIPTMQFGRTRHESTRTIFGAAAFWDTAQKDVDATVDLVLENGINHVDTAFSYRRSQEVLGNWIKRNGRPFFWRPKPKCAPKPKPTSKFGVHLNFCMLILIPCFYPITTS